MSQYIQQDGTAPLNDVTQRSRITGTSRRTAASTDAQIPANFVPSTHWGPIVASVVVGLAVTAMLIMIGVASGLIAGDENTGADETRDILAAIGAWSVIALAVGSFVGSFVGGRLTRWMDRLSIATHTLVSWGIATLLALALVSLLSIAFSSTATSVATSATAAEVTNDGGDQAAAANANGTEGAATQGSDTNAAGSDAAATTSEEDAADDTGDALGGAGWAIAVGMVLALLASAAGWFLGSRRRLTDIEREDVDRAAVGVS